MSVSYGSTSERLRPLAPDELAALEEQRDFLLQSLDDLEQEHVAGDVSDDDYEVLREDYTARSAHVIRAIEAHQTRVVSAPSSSARRKLLAAVVGVVLFAVGAGVLVAQSAGRRSASDEITGDIRTTTRDQLDEAIRLLAEDRYDEAIAGYNDILDTQPEHVEAMTYRGWAQILSGDVSDGIVGLTDAARIDPDYPDTHAFLAVAFWQIARTDPDRADYFTGLALAELDLLEALDPPLDIAELVAPLRSQIEEFAEQP